MSLPVYLLDTHTLHWREFSPKRLTPKVAQVFEAADAAKAGIILLPIVMAEFYYVLRKEGFDRDAPTFLEYIFEASGYQLEPLTWDDIRQLPSFPEVPEMHDRLIAIAAKRLGAVVLTRDPFLHRCSQIRCLW